MAKSSLQNFIECSEPMEGEMPFIHVTNGYNFKKILTGDLLKQSRCPVFKEDILYLFYGRPSYKTKYQYNERLAYDWPIVFLFEYKAVERFVSSMFPFDSGAFENERYRHFFDSKTTIDEFRVSRGKHNVRRIVSSFYSSNYEYFCGASRKNVEIPLDEFEISGVHELARVPNRPDVNHEIDYDERSSSIEILLKQPIPLKRKIQAIIIPQKLLDIESWQRRINDWEPNIIKSYSVIENLSPEAFAGMIYRIVEDLVFGEQD